MNDAQQELHQRSLRNVRALLDREQAELARQRRIERWVLWGLAPAVLLALGGATYFLSRPSGAGEEAAKRRLECEVAVMARLSGQREGEIRAESPNLTSREVARRVGGEHEAYRRKAAQECGGG